MIPKLDTIDSIPFPVLIADIGGTNTRFALLESADSDVVRIPDAKTSEYRSLEEAIERAVFPRIDLRPRSAVLALAGPTSGDQVRLTNSDWLIEPYKVIAQSGLEEIILLNDFEAASLSLPGLTAGDIHPILDGQPRANGTRVVVGPGTGLGIGALIRGHERWVPVPGEGGHIDLGPVSHRDFAIWPEIEKSHGRISREALISGPGLVRLYRGVCAADGVSPTFNSPREVTAAGLSESDPQAAETVKLFATYLGRLAGDLALIFMARGGVYLIGTISVQTASALTSAAFRDGFLEKQPHRTLLETIPSAIIVKKDAALGGIADYARAPKTFAVDLVGRRWQR